jgi:hypothetical protein
MEIKTFSSALVLSLLMTSPAVMAMEEDQDKGVVQAKQEISIDKDTEAQPPYSGIYNLWGLIGSSTSEPVKPVGTSAPARVGEPEIEKPASQKTTIILPSETSGQKTTTISLPESTTEPVSTPIAVAPEPEKKEEASTSTPAAAPQAKNKVEEPKGWWQSWFSSTPTEVKVEEKTPLASVSTETVTPPTQASLLTQSVMLKEEDNADVLLEKIARIKERAEKKKALEHK